MDEKMRDLKSNLIQVDEVWGFIGKKDKNADATDRRAGHIDVWTWIALDSETKLVPTFAVGDRTHFRGHLIDSILHPAILQIP